MSATFPLLAARAAALSAAAPPRLALAPLLGLFVLLVPFLLMCISLSEIGTLPVAGPPAPSGAGVDVRLHMRATSLNLEVHLRRARVMRLTVARRLGPGQALEAAYGELAEALEQVRGRYPAAATLTVVPGAAVPYGEVVGLLDALHRGIRSPRAAATAPPTTWQPVALGSPTGAA